MGLRAVQAGRSIGQGGSPWGAALSMFGGSLGNISGIGDISKFLSGPAGFAARYGLSQAMGRRRSGQGG